LKVISLWQPWASFIVYGQKAIETRGYATSVRGRVGIHATAREPVGIYADYISGIYEGNERQSDLFRAALFAVDQYRYQPNDNEIAGPSEMFDRLSRGSIIGTVELFDCQPVEELLPFVSGKEKAFGNYEPGRYGWLLRDPVLFKTPILAKGKQGWWEYNLKLCACGQPITDGAEHCSDIELSILNERCYA